MKNKEGFYCERCGEYMGEKFCDIYPCTQCGGNVEHVELHICPECGDGEYTSQSDWTCQNKHEQKENE